MNYNSSDPEAQRDELSGLYNRVYVSERLHSDIEDCIREKLPLSIIIADIDYFRVINDNCGHTAGDQVIKHFSQLLRTVVNGRQGWTARYGGEEFLACLPGVALAEALALAEELRQCLEHSIVMYRDIEIKLTASFGLAAIGAEANRRDDLIALALNRLTEAKEQGRNQVSG